jgi:hypothetical protein
MQYQHAVIKHLQLSLDVALSHINQLEQPQICKDASYMSI